MGALSAWSASARRDLLIVHRSPAMIFAVFWASLGIAYVVQGELWFDGRPLPALGTTGHLGAFVVGIGMLPLLATTLLRARDVALSDPSDVRRHTGGLSGQVFARAVVFYGLSLVWGLVALVALVLMHIVPPLVASSLMLHILVFSGIGAAMGTLLSQFITGQQLLVALVNGLPLLGAFATVPALGEILPGGWTPLLASNPVELARPTLTATALFRFTPPSGELWAHLGVTILLAGAATTWRSRR